MSDKKFNQFSAKLEQTLDEIVPLKTAQILAKRQFVEPWMTRGLDIASRNKMRLYKKTLSTDYTDEDIDKYKQHRNTYNSLKKQAKEGLLPY